MISGILFIAAVVGTGFLEHSYTGHYRTLQASETKAISHAIKENPLSVVDQGQDPQFPNLRDVLILTSGGAQENFYYDPSTGKVTYAGIEVGGGR